MGTRHTQATPQSLANVSTHRLLPKRALFNFPKSNLNSERLKASTCDLTTAREERKAPVMFEDTEPEEMSWASAPGQAIPPPALRMCIAVPSTQLRNSRQDWPHRPFGFLNQVFLTEVFAKVIRNHYKNF